MEIINKIKKFLIKYLIEYASLAFVSIGSIFLFQGIQIKGVQIIPDYSYVIVGAIFIGGAALFKSVFSQESGNVK